jgi:hypothetical protein
MSTKQQLMSTKKQVMEWFNKEIAPKLAGQIDATEQIWPTGWSKRFAYFLGPKGELVIVAGDQEGEKVDLALAYGLTYRLEYLKERPLVLVLPEDRAFPTLQRAPWFNEAAQPTVHLHDGSSAERQLEPLPTTDYTTARVANATGKTPNEELRAAATPLHLGKLSGDVFDLVEWATKHPVLDPGHRQAERAWHCMGQRVLSIRRGGKEATVRAGIHTTKTGEAAFSEDEADSAQTVKDLGTIKELVREGISQRLAGAYRRPDEHWLQALIRRDPTLVGVEQPALREVPAWRPAAKAGKPGQSGSWGRGFVDVVGLDGHGNLRIVETKLATNKDELLIFQGLDYYIWACAYRAVLLQRLGASPKAEIILHYVIGDDPDTGAIKLSHFAVAQAAALRIPWCVQTIHRWYGEVYEDVRPESKLYPEHILPT